MGLDVRDLRPRADRREDQFTQGLRVTDTNVNEEIVGTADVVCHDHRWQRPAMLPETLDDFSRVSRQPHRDQRLQRDAHGGRRDLGVIAAQHTTGLEAADPRQRARLGKPDPRRQLLVGEPSILLQQANQIEVDLVQR